MLLILVESKELDTPILNFKILFNTVCCSNTPLIIAQSQSSTSSKWLYLITQCVNDNEFFSGDKWFIAASLVEVQPSKISDSLKHPYWLQAMKSEVDAFEQNRMWTLTIVPLGKKPLGCKWVYKIKWMSDGSMEGYKALLIILRNTQVEGLYYHETFAPVAKLVIIRTLLTIVVAKN